MISRRKALLGGAAATLVAARAFYAFAQTPATQSNLLTQFPTGAAPGSILPGNMQNAIVSMPMPNITHAPFRPDFPPYSATFDGSTDNTSKISQMFSDITTQGFGEVILPSGICKIQGGSGLNIPNQCYMHGGGKGNTVFQRLSSSSTGLLFDMSGANNSSPKQYCHLADFQIDGLGAYSGGLLRVYYGNGHGFDNMQFSDTNDFGIQIVQLWDTVFVNCRFLQCGQNTSATAFTTGDEGGGTSPFGSEAIQILGATASSGFGFSSDSTNQVRFYGTLIESFSAGGIVHAKTTYGSSPSSHDVAWHDTKMESAVSFTGKYFVQMTADVTNIRLFDTYMGWQVSGGTNSGAQQGVYFSNNVGNEIRNLNVNCAVAGFQSAIKMFEQGPGEISYVKVANAGGTITKGVIWEGSGSSSNDPNVLGVSTGTAPSSLPTIQPGGYTLFHSGA